MGKITAIILAAGQGKRMNTAVSKQYLMLDNKPILSYTIKEFQNSSVDNIIIVCGNDDINFCKQEIVARYNFSKVTHIIEGGKERYESVFNALKVCNDSDYVLIHDGVRPFITAEHILACIDSVKKYSACVLGVPVKDTIKVSNKDNYVVETLDRTTLWSIQTPQAFQFNKIYDAYEQFFMLENRNSTDDAMVFEQFNTEKVKIILGDYKNIKITTIEDLWIADTILKGKNRNLKKD
jgi:2-C-methyl-D-erythritol 4-phosphate cytidylyltransferase